MSAKPAVKTHLLIDADVLAFVAAAASQRFLEDTYGYIRPFANKASGEAVLENMLHSMKDQLGEGKDTQCTFVLSDPVNNWRRSVDPLYKTNRTGERPLLLDHLKDYCREKYGAWHWEYLEADDTLSILMTTPLEIKGGVLTSMPPGTDLDAGGLTVPRLVCVGRDKDFKSIPGLHHSWKQDVDASGNMLVREVSPWEADRFHLMQALAGDRVDGFAGCPGIGMDRAAAIIDNPVRLVPQEGVKTRGVNKGEAVTKWLAEPTRDYWACIVSHYRKAGLGEPEALVTARLARLLRYGEYDPETHELTLWTPDMIRHGQSLEEHLSVR